MLFNSIYFTYLDTRIVYIIDMYIDICIHSIFTDVLIEFEEVSYALIIYWFVQK